MAIITFWSNGKEEVGKTLSIVAIATNMAIEHNKKILVISTSCNDKTLSNCYWEEKETTFKKSLGIQASVVGNQSGIEALSRTIKSKRIYPDIVRDYTKVVFKDRLEILLGYEGNKSFFEALKNDYVEIIKVASKCYDYIFVDLDNNLGKDNVDTILQMSTVVVEAVTQRISKIEYLKELRQHTPILNKFNTMILITKYNDELKYTKKNIERYLKMKNEVGVIPFDTLYFEACEEAQVPDLFLRLRRLSDEKDPHITFIKEVKNVSQRIIQKIEEAQMNIR
ncbi:MAG: hypothetical protein IJV31_03760 [Clostridia bacterium]|nr:hypothetical protein [Clostridia bacterium]